MANGRKVRSSEAVGLLRQWEVSGEPMSTWCEARGLNWYSLCAFKGWAGRGPSGFVEVVDAGIPASIQAEPEGRYRLVVGNVMIEVDEHFRSDTLQRLVRAVASC